MGNERRMSDTRAAEPFRVVALPEAFRVEDSAGRAISYTYFAEGARRSALPGSWTRDEARVIAERIARGFTLAATSK